MSFADWLSAFMLPDRLRISFSTFFLIKKWSKKSRLQKSGEKCSWKAKEKQAPAKNKSRLGATYQLIANPHFTSSVFLLQPSLPVRSGGHFSFFNAAFLRPY
jgi:hypothetical protein